MVKYFCSNIDIKSTWDHVVSAFWQRYPNPFSTHVLTEDVVYRELTADHRLLSRRLLMKTNRLPRWAERLFPAGMSRSVYIVEDSIVDPVERSLTTYTWNLNHTTLMPAVSAVVSSVCRGALRFPGVGGASGHHTAETGGVDILQHLWLLQTHSGVWIGPFQEQPGESPERPGVRTDQPARRGAPAAAQGHGKGRLRESQRGSQDVGLSRRHPTETPAVCRMVTVASDHAGTWAALWFQPASVELPRHLFSFLSIFCVSKL
ncbi:PRELI domain-containing protein 1, mitochondrial isoform X1 [Oryzias latipes]